MNPELRPAGAVVSMRFAQVAYGSVDSCQPRHSAWRLSIVHNTVELFSLVPNELKWLQRFVRQCHVQLCNTITVNADVELVVPVTVLALLSLIVIWFLYIS